MRGKAVALATSANWAFNFALGYFVPPAFVNIQWKTYIIFGVFNFAMAVHVFFAFPETAGKTLEEVESMFTDPLGPKYIGTLPWKTHIATNNAILLEHGEVDPEKLASFEQEEAEGGGIDAHVQAQEGKA